MAQINQQPPTLDLQGALLADVYAREQQQPRIADVKQVLDTLKDKVQPLTPAQMQVIGYLEYLQSRPIHQGQRPYDGLIQLIRDKAPLVAPPGFFIRVIEALIPRTQHIDGDAARTIRAEKEGKA